MKETEQCENKDHSSILARWKKSGEKRTHAISCGITEKGVTRSKKQVIKKKRHHAVWPKSDGPLFITIHANKGQGRNKGENEVRDAYLKIPKEFL